MSNSHKHYSRGYIESEEILIKQRIEWGVFWFILLACITIGVLATREDNEKQEAYDKAMQAKYNKWVYYREKNCKLTEQLFGVQVGEGKFAYKTNANRYECNDGMKYTVEVANDTGKVLSNIPEVK